MSDAPSSIEIIGDPTGVVVKPNTLEIWPVNAASPTRVILYVYVALDGVMSCRLCDGPVKTHEDGREYCAAPCKSARVIAWLDALGIHL